MATVEPDHYASPLSEQINEVYPRIQNSAAVAPCEIHLFAPVYLPCFVIPTPPSIDFFNSRLWASFFGQNTRGNDGQTDTMSDSASFSG